MCSRVMKNVKLHRHYNPYFAFKNIIGILGKELLLKKANLVRKKNLSLMIEDYFTVFLYHRKPDFIYLIKEMFFLQT